MPPGQGQHAHASITQIHAQSRRIRAQSHSTNAARPVVPSALSSTVPRLAIQRIQGALLQGATRCGSARRACVRCRWQLCGWSQRRRCSVPGSTQVAVPSHRDQPCRPAASLNNSSSLRLHPDTLQRCERAPPSDKRAWRHFNRRSAGAPPSGAPCQPSRSHSCQLDAPSRDARSGMRPGSTAREPRELAGEAPARRAGQPQPPSRTRPSGPSPAGPSRPASRCSG